MANHTVVCDACVFYPAPLRDLLMRLGMTNLFRLRWTDRIQDEWTNAIVRNRPELASRLPRTRELMNKAIPDATIHGYEYLIDTIHLPDPDDRHVVAAAVTAGADVIVTYNLKDFPSDILAQWEVEVQHPDDFICVQLDINVSSAMSAIRDMRAALKNPPQSVDQLLQNLAEIRLPQTVERVRQFSTLI